MSSFYKITKRKIAYDYGTISPTVYEILPYTNNNFVQQLFEYTKGNNINNTKKDLKKANDIGGT